MLTRFLFAALALPLALAGRSAAQCGPDGLDGAPACNMPSFTSVLQNSFKQPSMGICWSNCAVNATANYTAQWGALTPVQNTAGLAPSCGWYTAQLTLLQGLQLRWSGTFHFTYSRTWSEASSTGTALQVWRYLINGDLSPLVANPGPCGPAPICAASFGNKVRFTGYVDYAQDCGTTLTEQAWMITHACDAIDHAPGYPRAGAFHPNRFYSFVGPRLGFVPGAGASLEMGGAAVEAVRSWDATTLPAMCMHEEPLAFANFNPIGNLCVCGPGPGLWYEAFVNAGSVFGTILNPFPGSAPFRSFPVGTWTNPNAFPGAEELRYNTNELMYVECTGVGRQEFYFGVTTAGGYPARSLSAPGGPPLPPIFIDQSNSVLLPANVATRNRTYRSDHILNFNL